MGANFCKEDDLDKKAYEVDLSKISNPSIKNFEPPVIDKKKELNVIPFDLRKESKDNPSWNKNILNSVKIVETQGKEFKEFATSRVKTQGKQKVILGPNPETK